MGDEVPSPHAAPAVGISEDGRSLEIKFGSEQGTHRVDILGVCGEPAVGPHRIRSFQIRRDTIDVTYGKHCSARVTLPGLDLTCLGCD